jgi:hypothetical protein
MFSSVANVAVYGKHLKIPVARVVFLWTKLLKRIGSSIAHLL